jgi:hypothetical protein
VALPEHVKRRLLTLTLGILAGLLLAAIEAAASPANQAAIDAHKYADGVLLPRLTAAINDWHYQHPQDRPGHAWEHVHTTSAGDVARYREITRAFDAWREGMKQAGY